MEQNIRSNKYLPIFKNSFFFHKTANSNRTRLQNTSKISSTVKICITKLIYDQSGCFSISTDWREKYNTTAEKTSKIKVDETYYDSATKSTPTKGFISVINRLYNWRRYSCDERKLRMTWVEVPRNWKWNKDLFRPTVLVFLLPESRKCVNQTNTDNPTMVKN